MGRAVVLTSAGDIKNREIDDERTYTRADHADRIGFHGREASVRRERDRLVREAGERRGNVGRAAAKCSIPRRTLRIIADAVVSLGLLERDNGRYRNSAVAAAFLSGAGDHDLRPMLRFWDKLSFPRG